MSRGVVVVQSHPHYSANPAFALLAAFLAFCSAFFCLADLPAFSCCFVFFGALPEAKSSFFFWFLLFFFGMMVRVAVGRKVR